MKKGEKLYKTREVCEMLNISYRTLLMWIKQGKIKPIKVNRSYRIPESELMKVVHS